MNISLFSSGSTGKQKKVTHDIKDFYKAGVEKFPQMQTMVQEIQAKKEAKRREEYEREMREFERMARIQRMNRTQRTDFNSGPVYDAEFTEVNQEPELYGPDGRRL